MVCLGSVGKFWMDECLEVRVSGTWLKDFGFEYGHKIIGKYIEILNKLKIDKEKSCIILKQNSLKDSLLCVEDKDVIDLLISALQL